MTAIPKRLFGGEIKSKLVIKIGELVLTVDDKKKKKTFFNSGLSFVINDVTLYILRTGEK